MSLEKNDKITWVDVEKLKPHPKNTNHHPKDQIERLAKIINYQGFRSPIVVSNLSGFIVAGHGRLEAAKKLGLTKVPVSYQDFEDEKMELAHLNADNAIALWAEIDMKAMTESLKEINFDLDLDFLGFKDFKLDNETKPDSGDEDNIPETKENEFGVKIGDIYQLGEHRIMCGDSTDEASVAKLMNGQKADMVFTDPPYRFAFKGQRFSSTTVEGKTVYGDYSANTKHDEIKNDALSVEEFKVFIKKVCINLFNNLEKKNAWYICFAQSELQLLLNGIIESGNKWKNIIIWMKNQANLSNMDYKSRYEPIVYGQSGGCFFGERYKTEDIWEIQRTLKNDLHPTMKPIPLIEVALKNSSKDKNIILDLFLGSGSTLIACEKTNRICFGMELDPHYVSVIIKRWQDYAGKQAVKL